MKRTEIIAEIANAHQGRPELAIEIAKGAILAGADSIKFQMYTADDLLVESHKRYNHFKNQSFSDKEWKYILGQIPTNKVKVYLDIFGFESMLMSNGLNIHGYKIHFSDLGNYPLLKKLSKTGKELLIGSGGATLPEIERAINHIKLHGKSQNVTLLHGFQAYPTLIKDTNLNRLKIYKDQFGEDVSIGISDHIEGNNEFAEILPMMALPYGIEKIEKHVTINRAEKGVDYYSSLEISDFEKFVIKIREAESAIGNGNDYSDAEIDYRTSVKKKWVFKKDIPANIIISENDIIMKRDDSEIKSIDYKSIIGSKLMVDVKYNQIVEEKLFGK